MTPATIRAIRQALGLTAEGLGELLGVTGRTVRHWEAGTEHPRHATAERMLALEAQTRRVVESAEEEIGRHGAATVGLIRYRDLRDMLPGTAPAAIELHHAVLAALRLRYGERVAIVDWFEPAYRAWLGGHRDSQARRAGWAVATAAAR